MIVGFFSVCYSVSTLQRQPDAKTLLTPYVHALAPKMVAHLCSAASRRPESQLQLLVTVESLNCLEALVALAEPQHCKLETCRFRCGMERILTTPPCAADLLVLQLLVPILISCLLESTPDVDPLARSLHGHALHTLTRIGAQYSQVSTKSNETLHQTFYSSATITDTCLLPTVSDTLSLDTATS